jgi:hypothetical protein
VVDVNVSMFATASSASVAGSVLIEELGTCLDATGRKEHWQVTPGDVWCSVTPPGPLARSQGWKLHLSATPASAQTVLARAVPELLKAGCAFKIASTIEVVDQLNARHTSRGLSGKFVTIYPRSDEEAVRLAEALHQATSGLAGPRILSDRPYVPGSLVHYRYGAFAGNRQLSNDGVYSWVIFDPEGNPVPDRRDARYAPPAWAQCPFPQPGGNGTSARTAATPGTTRAAGANGHGNGVLVGDRFLVREAIRHTNKGGVYRAVDTRSGAEAIIKEARPHVAADRTGRDTRDLLRAEARALEQFEPLAVAPRLLALFEQSSHLFLAEELVAGVPLRQWVTDVMRERGSRREVATVLPIVERLVELLEVAHKAGFIIRDFNPNNVMVRPDGRLRFIDLELAVLPGDRDEVPARLGTPGFAAPEQMRAAAPAALEADYYGLGATICFVVTGNPPCLLDDEPPDRPSRQRLSEWLAARADVLDLPAQIRALILRLMDDEPQRRATTFEAMDVLAAFRNPPSRPSRSTACASRREADDDDGRLGDGQWQQAVDGIVDHLLDTMNPADDEQLWPVPCTRGAFDPCAVHLGAAGILGVLTGTYELTGDQRLAEAMATTGTWITRRLPADAQRSPGLYFGEAGIAWSLYEAGRALDDAGLAGRGLALADTLPVSSPNPDLTHGTAGIGLALLALGIRAGNPEFVERAGRSADALVASVEELPTGPSWGTPAAFESRLAGGRYHGYAHGTAGVGHFLLALGLGTGRDDCVALARRAGDTLIANATIVAAGDDSAALWGTGPDADVTAPYWCHGSAGIGGFLARLHRATGDDGYGDAARMSARAVMDNSWRGALLGQCHGLAGNGEFLLDMAEGAGGDAEQYEAGAHQLGRLIVASRAHRQGRTVFPDEDGGLSATWAEGMSGVLAFLVRLRHRSPRLWHGDPLLERSGRP